MTRAQDVRGRGRFAHRAVDAGFLWVLFWIGCLGVATGLVPNRCLAAESGSIRGVVRINGQGIAQHRIMLIRFGPKRDVQRTPGQTDAAGHFGFEGLETGEAFEYVVGIRYAERLYRSETVRLQPGQHRTGIVVEVTQTTPEPGKTSPSLLQITNHLKMVVYRDDHLEVREVVTLFNPGSTSSSGLSATPEAETVTLHLPLPQGFTQLTDIQGLDPEHVRILAPGLFYSAPLPPGEHRIVYTYALPFPDAVSTMLAERTLPTAVLDVLIEDQHLVASSDLQFRGRVTFEPHTFFHFRGTNLPAGTRSWIQLTRQSVAMPLIRTMTYGVIIGIVLLGIGLPFYGAWRHRLRQRHTKRLEPGHAQELNAARLRLLRAIVHLDTQHQSGKLADSEYHQQRQTYKTQLVELYAQLQDAQQDKDDSLERS